jgi:hypothetical protein
MINYIKKLLSNGVDPSAMRWALLIVIPTCCFCLVWSVINKYDAALIPISAIITAIVSAKAYQSKQENITETANIENPIQIPEGE